MYLLYLKNVEFRKQNLEKRGPLNIVRSLNLHSFIKKLLMKIREASRLSINLFQSLLRTF